MCKQKNNVLSFIHLIIVYILRISQVYNKKIIFITKYKSYLHRNYSLYVNISFLGFFLKFH